MRGITLVGLLSTLLAGACTTVHDSERTPVFSGEEIPLRLRNTALLWAGDVQRTADALARQRPAGLDAPLRLARIVRPGTLVDSEIVIRFAVDARGLVIDPQIRRVDVPTGADAIAVATLNAVRLWRFEPPMRAGAPTGYCCIEVTIENIGDPAPERRMR